MRNRRSQLGRRLLARSAGLEPRSAAALRSLAVRMIRGEDVDPTEFTHILPDGRGRPPTMSGIKLGYDYDAGEFYCEEAYTKAGRLAVMSLCGPVYFNAGFWEICVLGATPTAVVCEAFHQAADDGTIDALLVKMDCPGGSVAGATDLAAAIADFQKTGKRLYVLAYEMIASMGMWMSATADRIYATPTSFLGSIGTIIPMYDDAGMFEKMGVKPYPIASDPNKAVGMAGVPLTEENTADARRLVDTHFADFAARMDKGRRKPAGWAASLKAQIFIGADALEIGLCDEIVTDVRALIEALGNGQEPRPAGGRDTPELEDPPAPPPPSQEPEDMDLKNAKIEDLQKERPDLVSQIQGAVKPPAPPEPVPASIAELKSAFPDDAAFALDCAEKKLTLVDAKAAHADVLSGKLKAVSEKAAAHEKRVRELEALGQNGKGGEPVSTGPGAAAESPKDYEAEVSRVMKAENKTRAQAVGIVNAKHPELRKAYAGASR